ncbi:hypothetical protein PUNSTDRAFT_68270 [Punctularia strigosozonata HHB-11173 SS5]|uniref:uncharacterized protein n=1 Tax=Punctularia strigosozonata (strain HHB-11173) TaxID=741275 RepID=UPI00044163BF|nr:uncharacterized protein PUNSTDRAFT_68270 [Punctularia strigosozonata HHB-11173 SS5]EIN09025.1 hypothetical protein PUNSTDRAFT_68270 [Punctularia strigosozonata HHB-11173 SS5]
MARNNKRSKRSKHYIDPLQLKPFVSAAEQDAFYTIIADTGGNWDIIVTVLCSYFEIPPLTKRRGLKQIHENFETLYGRLDAVYKVYEEEGKEMVLGGIIGIFAKMCSDALLRDKLFEKGTLLLRMMSLLDSDVCRHVVLLSLASMTHLSGHHTHIQIACYARRLVDLVKTRPDDAKTQELCIVVLGHVVSTVTLDGDNAVEILEDIDITETIRVLLEAARKPKSSAYLISHALLLIQNATWNCRVCQEYEKNPSARRFITAFLRSDDISARAGALGSLIRLHAHAGEDDAPKHNSEVFEAAMSSRAWPPHINDAFMRYGPTKCETFIMFNAMNENQALLYETLCDSPDFYAIGKKLVNVILATDLDSDAELEDDGTWSPPFKMWSDVLLIAAKAIREKGKRNEAYLADILEVQYSFLRQDVLKFFSRARDAISRHPDVAFFYYIASFAAEREIGLRYAKKGLRCTKSLTRSVKLGLLERSIRLAGNMALSVLSLSHTHTDRWKEGIAYLASASEDAKTFLTDSPPDATNFGTVVDWYILLTLALMGKEARSDLKDFDIMEYQLTHTQDILERLRLNEDVMRYIGTSEPNSKLRLTRMTVFRDYVAAQKEWGDLIRHFDAISEKGAGIDERGLIDPQGVTHELTSWLDEKLQLEDEDPDFDPRQVPTRVRPQEVMGNSVTLYRCSNCGHPSAVLKKCGGCSTARCK